MVPRRCRPRGLSAGARALGCPATGRRRLRGMRAARRGRSSADGRADVEPGRILLSAATRWKQRARVYPEGRAVGTRPRDVRTRGVGPHEAPARRAHPCWPRAGGRGRVGVDQTGELYLAIADLVAGWALVGCGLVAWSRRSESRVGPLMVGATGSPGSLGVGAPCTSIEGRSRTCCSRIRAVG